MPLERFRGIRGGVLLDFTGKERQHNKLSSYFLGDIQIKEHFLENIFAKKYTIHGQLFPKEKILDMLPYGILYSMQLGSKNI